MCGLCGCSGSERDHHEHHDDANFLHTHHHDAGELVSIEQEILAKNQEFVEINRRTFLNNKITAINLMSSPGSGKTTLLAKAIADLKHRLDIAVIVGDQQTNYDAEKIQASGGEAIQINTGKVCHLDAHMVGHAVENLSLKKHSLLFIENVGNLVCPALFDLGEAYKVVILSVTEGDNKPLKYPEMFRKADLLLLTKTDLLPYVDFDINRCIADVKKINPTVNVLPVSATTGEGLGQWYEWLEAIQGNG
ncbi:MULTISPECIES: hydrogenase nickel incorporation protein HypB [unclassified Legionella]|uniref:hydrogenase nickel incorporation protein HypB n=1 Tax=unclassified Legionella TaxID=2622702 RepID=UPI001E38DF04|nr:hydrogenase nickel incorporation protein HypB [Legionella sp. 31fI33]MCC5015138.1 hydrogenase nickel incorporation protein HypB [Legionella sp. 31fI33]